MPKCILVVPCYNEAQRLQTDRFRDFLDRSPEAAVLFVNDGSTDDTVAVLKRLESAAPRAKVLDLPQNSGKAEAVRRGLLSALNDPGCSFVGFWDADLATPLDAVDDLLAVFATHPEVEMVFGSRVKLLGRQIERRPVRHYLGRVFATVASLVVRLPIYDTQCGAKLFRVTPDLSRVLERPFLSRWVFDVELIARFVQLHAGSGGNHRMRELIYEFPLFCWRDVPGSKVGPKDFVKAIRELLLIHNQYFR